MSLLSSCFSQTSLTSSPLLSPHSASSLNLELLCAGLAALAFALSIGLARVVVPEPWATRGIALVAISPPAVAYAATVDPAPVAAVLVTGAMRLALRMRTHPRVRDGVAAGALLAPLPWLGAYF